MTIALVPTGDCGFCSTGNHERCSVGVKHDGQHNKYPNGVVWVCTCKVCGPNRRKCAHCNNRTTEEVSPETWECFDVEGCHALVEAKRENDPLSRQLREIQEKTQMAKIENDKAKARKQAAKKEPVECACGCGDNTKGGKFLPGHDARFVSERVTEAINGKFSDKVITAQRNKMTKVGASEALVAKFEKSLGLAQEKQAKRDAAAEEKAKAKADKS